MMKCVAIIQDRYVRDAQVFSGDPAIMESDPDWESNNCDVKYPSLYVGIYEGTDENAIRDKAAESQGVHRDVITLIKV